METKTEATKPTVKPKVQQKTTAVEQKKEPTIYVGPNLKGGLLLRNTIFKDGQLPAHIKDIADEHRCIKGLIVPVSKLAEFTKRLADKTSVESARFEEAKTILSKGAQ